MRLSRRGLARSLDGIAAVAATLLLGLLLLVVAIGLARRGSAHTTPAPGVVWAWGGNSFGQLGNGTTASGRTPMGLFLWDRSISGDGNALGRLSAVSASFSHTLALSADGTVWAWGDNRFGQLGNGAPSQPIGRPAQVTGLEQVTAIAAGESHDLALAADGTVWAWGKNESGQLGNGTTTDSAVPVRVSGLDGVAAVSAGADSPHCSAPQSLALRQDATVWAWGNTGEGEAGAAGPRTSDVPVRVDGLGGVTAIAAGGWQNLALLSDGTVWAWRRPRRTEACQAAPGGAAGAPIELPATPFQVDGLSEMTGIATGIGHSLALKSDGTVWAWGANMAGQLGDGTFVPHGTPVQVLGLDGATAIGAGELHSVALKSDGTVWAWGDNSKGQLGNGGEAGSNRAVQVGGLYGVTQVVTGGSHGLALKPPPFSARTEGEAESIAYAGTWGPRSTGGSSGGVVMYAAEADPGQATFEWVGTSVVVLMVKGPQMGMAWISIDEQDSYLVDLYARTQQQQQVVFQRADLAPGTHRVTIASANQKNAYSGGYTVALDAIDTR